MKSFVFAALIFSPIVAQACMFVPGYEAFHPAVATFHERTVNHQQALLAAPDVTVVELVRGSAEAGASCNDAGWLTVNLVWPKTNAYKISEIGFYFRVKGKTPDQIFPLVPVVGTISGQRSRLRFVWLDGHPSQQKPLNLDVEVFAVNRGLEIGASRRFRVVSEKP